MTKEGCPSRSLRVFLKGRPLAAMRTQGEPDVCLSSSVHPVLLPPNQGPISRSLPPENQP